AEIGHPHAHRLTGFRHARHVERPSPHARKDIVAQRFLVSAAKQAGPEPEAFKVCAHLSHWRRLSTYSVSFLFRRFRTNCYFPAANADTRPKSLARRRRYTT